MGRSFGLIVRTRDHFRTITLFWHFLIGLTPTYVVFGGRTITQKGLVNSDRSRVKSVRTITPRTIKFGATKPRNSRLMVEMPLRGSPPTSIRVVLSYVQSLSKREITRLGRERSLWGCGVALRAGERAWSDRLGREGVGEGWTGGSRAREGAGGGELWGGRQRLSATALPSP